MKVVQNRGVWAGLMLGLLMGLVSLSLAQDPPAAPPWSYEGDSGPANWGQLDPSFSLCDEGQAQSPIDLTNAATLNLSDIEFTYAPSALNIFNNGHTIEVEYDAGSQIIYNEIAYSLKQFHFHSPSEHTLNGQPAAMEVHLVHQDAVGNLAVVGVLLVEGEQDNPAYAPIFQNLPTEVGEPSPMGQINAADLLPEEATFYTYLGSLTTPPCSQGVRWLVLTQPVALSAAQIESFRAIVAGNARPVQALNQRDLLLDSE